MALVVAVPLNTMLADLDESLRTLLKRELGRHGFDGVEVAFEAPTKEWASSLSQPTVSLFLYDLREAADRRSVDWGHEVDAEGRVRDTRPPLRVDASYAATAWTRAVEDEHRILSQLLAILYAFPELPEDALTGRLGPNGNGSRQPFPLITRVAQARSDGGADFWSAVGGTYKASIDFVVTMTAESGTSIEWGPEVRTQTVRLASQENRRGTLAESHRVGGTVRTGDGDAVAGAWVVVPSVGAWTSSDAEGRFRFDRIAPGTYACSARAADGREASGKLVVPGLGVDLVLDGARGRKR
jgi:Pvc16 N-terminal domain/Carboxypeptidase regulatory-like domain